MKIRKWIPGLAMPSCISTMTCASSVFFYGMKPHRSQQYFIYSTSLSGCVLFLDSKFIVNEGSESFIHIINLLIFSKLKKNMDYYVMPIILSSHHLECIL